MALQWVIMSNNNLLDPECCFAGSVARAGWHSGTWFCVMPFIANRRSGSGPRPDPASLGLNEAAMEAGFGPCTSYAQRRLGSRRLPPARPPRRISYRHARAKDSSAARARRENRARETILRANPGSSVHWVLQLVSSPLSCPCVLQMEASPLLRQTCEAERKRSPTNQIHRACTNQQLETTKDQESVITYYVMLLSIISVQTETTSEISRQAVCPDCRLSRSRKMDTKI